MHEMSIAMAVVAQVEEAAASAGAAAVTEVRLRVGELAGVVPDALAFCFELACADTLLAGAALAAETIPGRARCGACTAEWPTGMPPLLVCPDCDRAGDVALLAGRELEIAGARWEDSPGQDPAPTREPIVEEH
ncbi:hydrogenase maturation nickel metallochaperone HypA [Streptomyces toxytricini]|uniref:Hydrogenase maturation factor HypA n=1 Tax=Streptomyces toxytricini TaxID=67369 RepID=A0ABW8ECR1_STRT5